MNRLLTLLVLLLNPAYAAAGAPGPSLIEAVKAGDRAAVRALLNGRVDVTASEMDGTTALHWAALNGDVETVNALIRAKAGVNTRNRYGIAPIWVAAANGHADIVEALLKAGADPRTTRAESGETVLMAAAMAGHVPAIQRLLAAGADPNAADRVRQQTALMWAAAERHPVAARVLVEAGAKLETRSSSGLTPLMFAIRAGHAGTVTALIELGADLKATAPDGTTSLVLAMINAHWELAATLLERGADPNGNDPRGRPLHVLAFARRADNRGLSPVLPRRATGNIDTIDLARVLLARGAKVNDKIDWKNPYYTPTHMAISPVQPVTFVGATPLYIAAKNADVEFVKFLAEHGADPRVSTVQNVTPLLAAAGIGYVSGETPGTADEAFETVKLLQSLGNDVKAVADFGGGADAPTGGGWNGAGALHGATLRGAMDLVKWLIAEGVPLDRKTKLGKTPLDIARGSTLGINLKVWPEIATVLETAMRAKGLPVPDYKYSGKEGQLGVD